MKENCPQCGSVMFSCPDERLALRDNVVIVYVCPYGHIVKWRRQGEPFVTGVSSQAYYEEALERFHTLRAKRKAREEADPWEPIPGGSSRVFGLLNERRHQIEQQQRERQDSGGDDTPLRR